MIEPDDVNRILTVLELSPSGPPVCVKRETLRELVLVWLRVAALHEGIEQNPGEHTREEMCVVKTLLLGACECCERDTEPQNKKPSEPPTGVWQ